MELKLKFIFNIFEAIPGLALPRSASLLRSAGLALGVLILAAPLAHPQPPKTSVSDDTSSSAKSAVASQNQEPDTSIDVDPADPPAQEEMPAMLPHFKNSRFWLTGQANFIFQTHPSFAALYSGPHSLRPNYEKATSRVLTLYTGVRLNNSTELLVDIEEAGGDALSQGFGLAGNTDLDIVRNPSLSKAPYLGRGEIHKAFALSKDKVE